MSLDGLVKRLRMLEGARNIGDDSPLNKSEMKSIRDKLYEKNVFSTAYYQQFKRLMLSLRGAYKATKFSSS